MRREWEKLHTKLVHPTTERLFITLRRADATIILSTKETLDKILKERYLCNELQYPVRFRASIPPDKIVFNQKFQIIIMALNGKLVLHFVDTHTGYRKEEFVHIKTSERLWDQFLICWDTM